jgi:nitroreductase
VTGIPRTGEREVNGRPFSGEVRRGISLTPITLVEGLCTTRAIRRYTPDLVPSTVLRDIFYAATRAPSGSNRQPFRFVVFDDPTSAVGAAVRQIIGTSAREIWRVKRQADRYDNVPPGRLGSARQRLDRAMQHYVDEFQSVPVVALACLVRHRAPNPAEGASVYPACQNLLLAARAYGYGGVLTGFQAPVEDELRGRIGIPEGVALSATITIGRPVGRHGPVRRRPMADLIYGEQWGTGASWAIDPVVTATASSAGGEAVAGMSPTDGPE